MKKSIFFFIFLSAVLFAQNQSWEVVATNAIADTTNEQSFNMLGRSIKSGCDLDNDGLYEIITTQYGYMQNADETYSGFRALVWEVTADNTVELVWASPIRQAAYPNEPRWVETGDLDGNGKPEIIFAIGALTADELANNYVGYNIYEWDGVIGSDNYGTEPVCVFIPNHTPTKFRPEGFRVADIDDDGKDELVHANFSFNNDAGVGIYEFTSNESGVWSSEEEFYYGTANFENPDMNCSFSSVNIGDANGNGKKEVWFIGNAQNTGRTDTMQLIIEATSEDTYVSSDVITYQRSRNNYALFNTFGNDFDNNGVDEIIYPEFATPALRISNLNQVETADTTSTSLLFDFSENAEINAIMGMCARGNKFYLSSYSKIFEFKYNGCGVSDPNNWEYNLAYFNPVDTLYGSGVTGGISAPSVDLDGDGKLELILIYQGITDTDAGLNQDLRHIRILEPNPEVNANDEFNYVCIDDYKLSNYPNPFNPSTNISFTLPVNKKISLSIYNVKGQLVKNILANQQFAKGTHSVVWNGKDNYGNKVASGVYFTNLKFGNFSKTKKIMMLK